MGASQLDGWQQVLTSLLNRVKTEALVDLQRGVEQEQFLSKALGTSGPLGQQDAL